MLQLLLGRSGSGKSHTVFDRLEALARDGQEKVFLLVPEQYSFASERELLTRLGAQLANSIAVVSFTRLADTVFREIGGMAGEQLDDGMRALLMSRALGEVAAVAEDLDEPLFGADPRQVTDSAYVAQMLDLWEEMRVCAVPTEELARVSEELAAQGTLTAQSLQEKAKDFSRIFDAYMGLVADSGLQDTDKLTRLAQVLPHSTILNGATVLVDGFKGFTAQELAILDGMLSRVAALTVTLCTDTAGRKNGATEGTAREGTLFSPVTDTVGRLMDMASRHGQAWGIEMLTENRRNEPGALHLLEAGLYAPVASVMNEPTDAVTITPCLDVYEECAYVARRIRRLMREDGLRARDITLVARDLSAYSGLLEDALEAEGVPCSVDRRQALLDEPLIVYMRAALRVAVGGWRTEELLRLLKTDLSALTPVETAQVENYVYMWGIDGAAWTTDWTENPAGMGQVVTPASARQLARLNQWRRQVIAPLQTLREALRGGAYGRAFSLALYRYLTDDGELAGRIARRVSGLEELGEITLAEHTARVWDEAMALLDRFALVLGDYRLPSARLEELFTMLAQMVDLGQIPQGLDAVTIGAADRIRYHHPRVVFVLGANEGVFPAYPEEGGLLSEEERRTLKAHGVELSDDLLTRCIEERYFVYMAIAAPCERLFVSFHTAGEATPSPLVAAIEQMLPRCRREVASGEHIADVESGDAMFARLAANYTRQVAAVESLKAVLADEPVYSGRLSAVARAAADKPFAVEDDEVAAALFGKDLRLSASQTKKFYQCRFAYFCQYGLRLQARKPAQVDNAAFGTIVHYVMERLLPQYTCKGGLLDKMREQDAAREAMDKAAAQTAENALQAELLQTLTQAVHDTVMAYVTESMGGLERKTGRFLYLLELAQRAAYNILWHTLMELRQGEFLPARFELEICPTNAQDTPTESIPSLHITFPRGSVRLSGKVDRVDLYVRFDGKAFVRVVDYKTGSDSKFDLSEVSQGLNMQMLLYLFTICDCPQRLLADADSLTPAGVLYHPLSDLAVARGAGDQAMKKRLSSMRMDGVVLHDPSVVQAMERDAQKVFIPAKLDKGGEVKGNVLTIDHFALLRGVVEELLVNMANGLLDGDIPALPIRKGDYTPCTYCDYRAVCARDEDAPTRELDKKDFREALADLEAREGEVSEDA